MKRNLETTVKPSKKARSQGNLIHRLTFETQFIKPLTTNVPLEKATFLRLRDELFEARLAQKNAAAAYIQAVEAVRTLTEAYNTASDNEEDFALLDQVRELLIQAKENYINAAAVIKKTQKATNEKEDYLVKWRKATMDTYVQAMRDMAAYSEAMDIEDSYDEKQKNEFAKMIGSVVKDLELIRNLKP